MTQKRNTVLGGMFRAAQEQEHSFTVTEVTEVDA